MTETKGGPGRRNILLSWLWVGLCILAIFLIAPTARFIQDFVARRFSRSLFGYAVLAAVAAGFLLALAVLVRRGKVRAAPRILVILAVGAAYVYLTFRLWPNPEEAVHFLEYGVLGFLLYRALRHRVKDPMIYVMAFLIGSLVGIVDEIIQWALPSRLWDLRDVGLNALAVALLQVALGLGIRPHTISLRPTARSARLASAFLAANLLLLGLCLSNTPERVAAYSRIIPGLAFLEKEEPMRELVCRHEDREAGTFYSRLTVDWLEKTDLQRGDEYARLVRDWKDKDYAQFLRAFPAVSNPFLYEFRVRVFRRDRRDELAGKAESPARRAEALFIAYKENLILEKYFGRTLEASGYRWGVSKKTGIEALVDVRKPYTSPVASGPLNTTSDLTLWAGLSALLLLLVLGNVLFARASAARMPDQSPH